MGSISGAFSAAITTPLDVAKTRLMLGKDIHGVKYKGTIDTLIRLYYEQSNTSNTVNTTKNTGNTNTNTNPVTKKGSLKVLFSGVIPRTVWIGLGGFIFFGSYEYCKSLLM